MYSSRFGRSIRITRHAASRMNERNISITELGQLVEAGDIRHKDSVRLWIAGYFPKRTDNLICVPVVLEATELVIKTAMHHFCWEG